MHPLKGKKQSKEHVAKRMAAMAKHPKWPGGHPPRYTAARLWENVRKGSDEDCWPWLGWTNEHGYGRVEIDGKSYYAHRVIYQLAYPGSIKKAAPKDRTASGFLRHRCDNPICCNPNHLLIGTQLDNMRDKVERGRSKWYDSSVESPNAKLTAHDVREIRRQFNPENGATRKALALLYDVSVSTIKGVISGRHYADV